MKKKIAGVLTTVLAASLFVGGNVPVTTQVGSMAAESQEDEDTQADEAEAESGEDTQSEVDEEEAKVAADPEDQPGSCRDTGRRGKSRERNTETRGIRRYLFQHTFR